MYLVIFTFQVLFKFVGKTTKLVQLLEFLNMFLSNLFHLFILSKLSFFIKKKENKFKFLIWSKRIISCQDYMKRKFKKYIQMDFLFKDIIYLN